MRWGELTALARRHAVDTDPAKPKLRVARAWKSEQSRGYYLGKPKTKKSRRTIRVSATVWRGLCQAGLYGLSSNQLVFHNGQGKRLPYSTFYDRWMAAVAKAHAEGTLPDFKVPTFHDLRHSHASALISAGHSLTYVQRRLGHESIQTTSDRYGHLLPEADDAAMDTIDESLRRDDDAEETAAPVPGARGTVYVAHLGERLVGFWKRAHALETSGAWGEDSGGATRVETWSAQWWSRTVGNGVKDIRSEVCLTGCGCGSSAPR